jgi:hypothetical protein
MIYLLYADGVGVTVGVGVGVGVPDAVTDGVGVGVAVSEGVTLIVGVTDGVGVGVSSVPPTPAPGAAFACLAAISSLKSRTIRAYCSINLFNGTLSLFI